MRARLGVVLLVLIVLLGGVPAFAQSPWSGCDFITGGSGITITCPNNTGGATFTNTGGGSGGAPIDAKYWVSTADAVLTQEVNLGALSTGLILGTVAAGTSTPSTYAGTSCTNQFPRSLNASGQATCASVGNADLVNPATTVNGVVCTLGSTCSVPVGTGTVTSFSAGDLFPLFTTTEATETTTPALTFTLSTAAANTVFGNATGSTGSPVFNTMTSVLDSAFGSTRGQILFRGNTAWQVLAVGTATQYLKSGGAGADVSWSTPGGAGTVTSFSAGDLSPLFTTTEATVTTTPALSFTLSTAAANTLFGNATGSTAAPAYNTVTSVLDSAFGSTRGMILYRGASNWTALAAGTSGQVLSTGGTGGNPSWITNPSGTVTTVSATSSVPGFSFSVATATTTPAITMSGTAVGALTVFANATFLSSNAADFWPVTTLLDNSFGSTVGALLVRNSAQWANLAAGAGTAGNYLRSNGTGAEPSWSASLLKDATGGRGVTGKKTLGTCTLEFEDGVLIGGTC
jgi:formylmethanofuran dehydrogenase subunit D